MDVAKCGNLGLNNLETRNTTHCGGRICLLNQKSVDNKT